jgi:hypothetical protein
MVNSGSRKIFSCLLALQTCETMKLKIFFLRLFSKRVKRPSIYSEAISEGIVDMFKEMGYKL